MEALERSVVRHNAYARHAGEQERFVTALVVAVDPLDSGTAQAVNCGHLPPYLVRDGGPPQRLRLEDTGVPLGLASLVDEERSAQTFRFPPDSTLLLYTDGLSEARDGDGLFYPLADRLAALVAKIGAPEPEAGGTADAGGTAGAGRRTAGAGRPVAAGPPCPPGERRPGAGAGAGTARRRPSVHSSVSAGRSRDSHPRTAPGVRRRIGRSEHRVNPR
ncbi:PP2C family protein-serine/threonine phosphatase [Streptomyces albus]